MSEYGLISSTSSYRSDHSLSSPATFSYTAAQQAAGDPLFYPLSSLTQAAPEPPPYYYARPSFQPQTLSPLASTHTMTEANSAGNVPIISYHPFATVHSPSYATTATVSATNNTPATIPSLVPPPTVNSTPKADLIAFSSIPTTPSDSPGES